MVTDPIQTLPFIADEEFLPQGQQSHHLLNTKTLLLLRWVGKPRGFRDMDPPPEERQQLSGVWGGVLHWLSATPSPRWLGMRETHRLLTGDKLIACRETKGVLESP